jgi:hypothetical protein
VCAAPANFVSPASFWTPDYLCPSNWTEHAPFAFWLTEALRPRCFVELGVHFGFSYFCFCQAIKKLGLEARAFGVDSWQWDSYTGPSWIGYDNVVAYNSENYSSFSTLLKMTFAEALEHFDDGSVDLLHIDGQHSYEAVKCDYEMWLPKLTDDAVVLLHDTNVGGVGGEGFEVWKLFRELSLSHPWFVFPHCAGLGLLAPYSTPKSLETLLHLFEVSPQVGIWVRDIYAELGRSMVRPNPQAVFDSVRRWVP